MKKVSALFLAIVLLISLIGVATQAAGEEVKLNMILTNYGRFKPAVDDLIEKFIIMQKEKNGITVSIDVEYPQEKEVLASRLANDESPDIFNLHVALDAPLYDKGGFLPDLSDEPVAALLYDGVRDMATIDGRLIAIPLESFVWNCLYNKTLFKEHGLTFPNTISELKHVIETFSAAGIPTFSTPFNDPGQFVGWSSQVPMCAVAAQLVPDFYEKMEAGEGSFQSLVDNGWLDVVDLIFANGTSRALDTTTDDGLVNFANGDGAILMTGPWYSNQIMEANPDFELGLGALPIDENPENAVVMLAVSTGITYSPDSKNAELAKDFVTFVLDNAVTNEFFSACQFNQLASNQDIEMFPWTADGVKYVEQNRIYAEHGMPSAVYTAIGRGAQMLFDKQIDRAAYVEMLDEAYASGMEALSP